MCGSPRCYISSLLSFCGTHPFGFCPCPLAYLFMYSDFSDVLYTGALLRGGGLEFGGARGWRHSSGFSLPHRHPWFPPRPDPAPHAPHVAPKTALAPAVARPGRRAPCFRPWPTHATLPRESIHGQPQKVLEVVCRSGSCMRVVRTPCWMASARAWSGSG